MATVAYDRQTINSPNPIARFAHRARMARSLNMASQLLPQGGSIVDFGAGTGFFLSALGDRRPDIRLQAVEPYMAASTDSRIAYSPALSTFAPKSVDLITALETCEHLTDDELRAFIADARAALATNGKLIVSVPIMVGLSLPVKELNRALLFRRLSDYSPSEMTRATFGGAVERPENRLPTHKGFDFRWLRSQLERSFTIERLTYSPLPLPWWANSQAFFICR